MILKLADPHEVGMDAARLALIKTRMGEWRDAGSWRSGVLLAARQGKLVFHEAIGPLTHKANSAKAEKDSVFALASVSKPLTATAIMILVEDGLLGLNRPIREYLPEISGQGTDDVEVQHLLTHTSGFSANSNEGCVLKACDECRNIAAAPDSNGFPYIRAYLDESWDLGVDWAPGSRMDYSNRNYVLLSEIVRRASGKTLDVFSKERIFQPLGMADTTSIRDRAKASRTIVRGPGTVAGTLLGNDFAGLEGGFSQDAPWGSTGATTTAMDLARFGQLFLNGGELGGVRLLSPPSVREMTRNQIPGVEAEIEGMAIEAAWGLGWMIQANHRWRWANGTLNPVGTFYHMGSGGIVLWCDPQSEVVAVFMGVCNDISDNGADLRAPRDLFINMVMASVLD